MSKAERTKRFIIEQAAPIFNTKGVSGTSISDVLKSTKMAKGGIYGHFESKEVLAEAVVVYNLQWLVDSVSHAIEQEISAKNKLFAFLNVFSDPLQFPVPGGCPILNFGTEADDTNPIVKSLVKETIIVAQDTIATIVRSGITNKEFKASFNPELFSIKVMTLIEGGTLIGRILDSNHQMGLMIDLLKNDIEEMML